MKKTVIIVSVLAAMLALASCGNVNENTAPERTVPAAQTNAVVTEANAGSQAEEPQESADSEESSAGEQSGTAEAAGESEKTGTDSTAPLADNTAADTGADETLSDSSAAAPVQQDIQDTQTADPSTVRDSGSNVDMDDLKRQLEGSLETLNHQVAIAKGSYADITVFYDSDFSVTENRDELAYYAVPESYREECENLGMTLYSGHFTRSFISSMGLDDAPSRFVEHEGTLYFRADKYTAHRPEYYVLMNDDIRMDGDTGFHVDVTDGHGTYDLSFVYEPSIAANTGMWKMDAMTFQGTLN